MEVRQSSMIGPNIAMWLHIQAAFCFYISFCMSMLSLSYYLDFSFFYAIIFWATFDVHALVVIAKQHNRYPSEVTFSDFFKKGHDYGCTLLFKVLLLLGLEDTELKFWTLGLCLFLPLAISCCSRSDSQDFQHLSAFGVSVLNRIFRAAIFTLVVARQTVGSAWPWELVLFPLALVGMLMLIILAFGLFFTVQQVREYLSGNQSRSAYLTAIWYELTGLAYAVSLMVWYHGGQPFIEGEGSPLLPCIVTVVMYTGLCIYIVRNRHSIQYFPYREYHTIQAADDEVFGDYVLTVQETQPKHLRLEKLSGNYFKTADRSCDAPYTEFSHEYDYLDVRAASYVCEDSQLELCYLCFTAKANAVFMECGHGGLCKSCAVVMMQASRPCYLCRAAIVCVYEVDSKAIVKAKVQMSLKDSS